jgi:hypothetical protein
MAVFETEIELLPVSIEWLVVTAVPENPKIPSSVSAYPLAKESGAIIEPVTTPLRLTEVCGIVVNVFWVFQSPPTVSVATTPVIEYVFSTVAPASER